MSPDDELIRAPLAIPRSAPIGPPDEHDLELINRIAPQKQKRSDLCCVRVTASSNALDSFYTHMDVETTLRAGFVPDMNAGVGVLDSHDSLRLPLGQTYFAALMPVLSGKLEGIAATHRVDGRFYMVLDTQIPGSGSTNDYKKLIESGTTRHVSVGFGGRDLEIVCDIDGRSIWDWDSPYYPGQRLDDGTIVTYTVRNGRLYELSLVYKASTPGALIARVAHMASERRIKADEATRLSRAMGHRFDVPSRSYRPAPPARRNEFLRFSDDEPLIGVASRTIHGEALDDDGKPVRAPLLAISETGDGVIAATDKEGGSRRVPGLHITEI